MKKIINLILENNIQTIITIIFWMVFLKYVLKFPTFYIFFLMISIIVMYFLSKWKSKILWIVTFFIILINIITLIFVLVPTYEHEIEIESFYKNQQNNLTINIKDSKNELLENNANIIITSSNNPNTPRQSIQLWLYNEIWKSIELFEWDKISFNSKSNKLKSTVNVNLRDWTTFRVLPQSIIKLDKVTLNANNIIDSKTKVSIDKWTAWFNIIKTIASEDTFNIWTSNWVLVIRWTSWLISYNNENKNTTIYSNNHIIEIINNKWLSEFVSKWEIFKFNNIWITQTTLQEFRSKFINTDIFKDIQEFKLLDNEDINKYRNEFNVFIEKNFKWKYNDYKYIKEISEIKMMLLSKIPFDSKTNKKYIQQIENYEIYKAFMWDNIKPEYIKSNIEKLIITPFNSSLKKLKIEYIKSNEIKSIKHKLISVYNTALDSWKNLNIDEMKDWIKKSQEVSNLNQIKVIIEQIIIKYFNDINFDNK